MPARPALFADSIRYITLDRTTTRASQEHLRHANMTTLRGRFAPGSRISDRLLSYLPR